MMGQAQKGSPDPESGRLVGALSQGAEGARVAWAKPCHLFAGASGAVQREAESADRRERVLKVGERCRVDRLGWHEREEHRGVGRAADGRRGVPVPRHGRFSLGDDDQAALGTWACPGRP